MTGVAAVLGKEEGSVASAMASILEAMKIRGSLAESTMVKADGEVLTVGSCRHSQEHQSASSKEGENFAMDGSSFDVLLQERLRNDAGLVPLSRLFKVPGAFSFLAISAGKLLAARDPLGQKPLYYGTGHEGMLTFASLKTALKKVGVADPTPVPPGKIVAASKNDVFVVDDNSLSPPKEVDVPELEAVRRLGELLLEALAETVPRKSAVAFSGGLDSTLVAMAAKKTDLGPELITVGVKGQDEIDHARRVAKSLGLRIVVKEFSAPEVLESIADVVRLVESIDPTLVGISIPLYFACQTARDLKMRSLVAGQLSDELFAGYGRFDDLALKNQYDEARREVWNSVLSAPNNDFEPGDKLAVSHHLELRCPFAYLPLVQYSLQLPISLKLRVSGDTVVRKYVLRELAADWKLPGSVVNRPKKAVQYSSGVQKVLIREAKRRGLSLSALLESYLTN